MSWTEEQRRAASERMKRVWANYSSEERAARAKRDSEGRLRYFANMSDKEREEFCHLRSEALTEEVRGRISKSVVRTWEGKSDEEKELHRLRTSLGGLQAVRERTPEVELRRQVNISLGVADYHVTKSDERKKRHREKMTEVGKLSGRGSRGPTEPEIFMGLFLERNHPGEWKYTGDRSVWLGNHNPDFMNINGKKEIIEVFGSYHHDTFLFPHMLTPDELITHYAKYGFRCWVFWDYEVYDRDLLKERLGG